MQKLGIESGFSARAKVFLTGEPSLQFPLAQSFKKVKNIFGKKKTNQANLLSLVLEHSSLHFHYDTGLFSFHGLAL